MAILGYTEGFFTDVIKVFLKQNFQLLFVSEDEPKNKRLIKQLEHLEPAADIEFISCEREGCWVADIIAIIQQENVSTPLVEKIKEVATQKIVLVISDDKNQTGVDLNKALPHSKIVEIKFNLQEKRFRLFDKDAEAKKKIQKIFEGSNYQLNK